ncbi:hypothetical protein PHYSODRAFT_511199 [Phytophthora sojae]|uniref:Spondin-like TSP1 domain-containing protein n=2 Tax=Phytophthora sojae (strain P6497) TaxID=1094619 RepID=G4ZUE9_PHYSP|nr:hypothetical protein PHYSODRAFT_511199 [Phytophthora sojae]EGZ13423.1 hypothetical protein PHYSODRAFT_511199 [Phytophthora sojae]|eukprot:XP_009530852.1 hypothetical protein PHYSODRAFT_511199 [Phytophthora sojae]
MLSSPIRLFLPLAVVATVLLGVSAEPEWWLVPPIDCQVGPWGDFSGCSAAYSTVKTRRRNVVVWPLFGGAPCPALEESQPCVRVDCQVGPWSAYTCNPFTGWKTRSRVVTVRPQDGGAACPALSQSVPCDPINCVVSDWTPWSTCLLKVKSRARTVQTFPLYGGLACPSLVEVQACVPVDCAVGAWSAFKILGTIKTRSREDTCQPDSGLPCPPLVEQVPCNPVDCSPVSRVSRVASDSCI